MCLGLPKRLIFRLFSQVAEELEEMQNKKDKMDARISENLDEEKRAAAKVSEKRKVWQETLGRHEPLKKKLEALDADHKQLSERKAKLQRKKSEFQNKSGMVAISVIFFVPSKTQFLALESQKATQNSWS